MLRSRNHDATGPQPTTSWYELGSNKHEGNGATAIDPLLSFPNSLNQQWLRSNGNSSRGGHVTAHYYFLGPNHSLTKLSGFFFLDYPLLCPESWIQISFVSGWFNSGLMGGRVQDSRSRSSTPCTPTYPSRATVSVPAAPVPMVGGDTRKRRGVSSLPLGTSLPVSPPPRNHWTLLPTCLMMSLASNVWFGEV